MSPNSATPSWVRYCASHPGSSLLRSLSFRCWAVVFDDPAVLFIPLPVCVCAGQLLWRRFDSARIPSHHSLCAACMQLLPLVEMYCKWELQEDCSNLGELMRRFDSEAELQSHDLGRSMLQIVRDDDVGLHQLLPRSLDAPTPNPFAAIRSSLAAVDAAFQGMQPQVHVVLDVPLDHEAHRCSSCHWAAHCACVHSGLCPNTFNAKFFSPATMFSFGSLPFLPTPRVGMSIRFLCAPLLAPGVPCCEPSLPASMHIFFSWNTLPAPTVPFPPPGCRQSVTRPPAFLLSSAI